MIVEQCYKYALKVDSQIILLFFQTCDLAFYFIFAKLGNHADIRTLFESYERSSTYIKDKLFIFFHHHWRNNVCKDNTFKILVDEF